MTETQEKSQNKASDKPHNPEVSIETPNRTVRIRTAEDAQQQFLRGVINEDQLRDVLAAHGVTSIQFPRGIEPMDLAFENKIPEDLVDGPVQFLTVDERQKLVDDKQAVRDAANKASEKVTANAEPSVPIEELKNEEATKAADKVEEKQNK